MKYFITYHAIERLKERFPVFYNKIPELKEWNKTKGTESVKKIFDNLVMTSEENKSYLNNSVYMLKLYDKYGYDSEYCFLEQKEENILFVMTKNRSEKYYRLVTVMPTEFRPSAKNIKYNNKDTKKNKYDKFVMDWYDNLKNNDKESIKKIQNSEDNKLVVIDCCSEIKTKLIKMVAEQKTQRIATISNSKSSHKAIINDLEYEFIYSKTTSGNKDITLQKMRELSYEEKNKDILEKYLTPELKKELLNLVYNGLTIVKKISNSREMHQVEWKGSFYNFLFHKTSTGDRKILLQEIPQVIENKQKMKIS